MCSSHAGARALPLNAGLENGPVRDPLGLNVALRERTQAAVVVVVYFASRGAMAQADARLKGHSHRALDALHALESVRAPASDI